jgi:hypothetical protein
MARYEDPSEDPAIIEAVVNIKMAIRHIALVAEYARSTELQEAMADLEQAVRYLEGKEEPG